MDCDAKESITKLRQLREELCKKQEDWKSAFTIKDMIVSQLKAIKESATDPDTSKEDILNEIDSILVLIDPDRQKELEG